MTIGRNGGARGLDPTHLTPAASLNRARIVDLPGIRLEDSIRGKTAYELLATQALAEDVRCHAGSLSLDALRDAHDTDLLPAFARCVAADAPHVRATAETIVRRFGRSLGALILMLKRGDAINRRARPDWDDTYWDHWAGVGAIWLGGGLAHGPLGERIRHHAAALLAEDEAHACALHVATHPSLLPLIGAARGVSPACEAALVFDFGQSAVKRALARYDGDALTGFRPLPSVPSPATFSPNGDEPTLAQVRDLAERMVAVMAATRRSVAIPDGVLAPLCVAGIASYITDGQPLPRQGGPYAQLHRLSGNAARWMARQVSQRLGRPLDVELIHDGTAAARTYAGSDAAVIMLGTALGVGFAPPLGSLCPLAHDFSVQDMDGGG